MQHRSEALVVASACCLLTDASRGCVCVFGCVYGSKARDKKDAEFAEDFAKICTSGKVKFFEGGKESLPSSLQACGRGHVCSVRLARID